MTALKTLIIGTRPKINYRQPACSRNYDGKNNPEIFSLALRYYEFITNNK